MVTLPHPPTPHLLSMSCHYREINKIILDFYNSKIKNFVILLKIDANSYERNLIASHILVPIKNSQNCSKNFILCYDFIYLIHYLIYVMILILH